MTLFTTAEPRLKLSVLLDLAVDSWLARLPQAKVLEVHASKVEPRGAKSSEDIEPSLSSSSESEEHNVEPIIEQILTEGELERVALSCRFALDLLCEKGLQNFTTFLSTGTG